MDYTDYISKFHPLLVIKCQMINIEYMKIPNLDQLVMNFKKFEKISQSLRRQEGLIEKTIVIDIENTIVKRIEVKNKEEIERYRKYVLNWFKQLTKNNLKFFGSQRKFLDGQLFLGRYIPLKMRNRFSKKQKKLISIVPML